MYLDVGVMEIVEREYMQCLSCLNSSTKQY
jgi:hypothetical protein